MAQQSPIAAVVTWLKAHPGDFFTVSILVRDLSYGRDALGRALGYLNDQRPDLVRRVGKIEWEVTYWPEPESRPELRHPEPEPELEPEPEHYREPESAQLWEVDPGSQLRRSDYPQDDMITTVHDFMGRNGKRQYVARMKKDGETIFYSYEDGR